MLQNESVIDSYAPETSIIQNCDTSKVVNVLPGLGVTFLIARKLPSPIWFRHLLMCISFLVNLQTYNKTTVHLPSYCNLKLCYNFDNKFYNVDSFHLGNF